MVAGDCSSLPRAHKGPFCLELGTPLCLKGEVVLLQAQQERGEQLHETPNFMSRELQVSIPPASGFWCAPEVFRMISPAGAELHFMAGTQHSPEEAGQVAQ